MVGKRRLGQYSIERTFELSEGGGPVSSTAAADAFELLMRTAFADPVVVLRSATHEIELELPEGATVSGFGAADAAPDEPPTTADDDATAKPWWHAPGVDEQPAAPAGPSAGVVALQQQAEQLRRQMATGAPADVAALFALSDSLRGLALAELAEMDATGSHLTTGAPTTASWLREQRTVSDVAARAEVRLATALREELPGVGALLRQGAITVEHARAAVAGTRGLDPRVVQDSDPAICALVTSTDPPTVRAYLRERAEAINPELGRESERRAHERRGLTLDQVGSSGGVLGGSLGVEDTEIVLLGLDLAVQADRSDGDLRSLRQRRADALVQWARQAAAQHSDQHSDQQLREDLRTTRSQLLLGCTLEQLNAARLAVDDTIGWSATASIGGARIPAGGTFGPGLLITTTALRRLVCDASISLVITDDEHPHPTEDLGTNPLGIRPDQRTPDPLYVGRAARIVTAAQWRALVVRDRHCVIKGCRRRPLQCQAHHVRHWLDGGTTDLDNLVLLCFQHHHEHHDRNHDLPHRDGRWITQTGWGAQAPP